MATLILSSAGSAVGGPLGASVGKLIGREIDKGLRGGGRGAGLSDLRVQTSHYGSDIPAIYGRMRVAGPVVWATDLVPTAAISKSGARHSYSVSFAVAVSSRPVKAIGRIWSDGRLIRGSAGDHKVPFELRIHLGEEDEQDADELIASVEDRTPAYRGIALLVFEDFDLSTFGNHLPQISVEVDAGDGDLGPESVFRAVGAASPTREDFGDRLVGYAMSGDDIATALSPLAAAFGTRFAYSSGQWETGKEPIVHRISADEMLADESSDGFDFRSKRAPADKLSIRYFDEMLDFAAGEKSARTAHTTSPASEVVVFPGALTSDTAKALAHARLASRWTERARTQVNLPLIRSDIGLGDIVELPSAPPSRFSVVEKVLSPKSLQLKLLALPPACGALASESGRMMKQIDLKPAPVHLAIVELPYSDSAQTAGIGIAVAGGSQPFKPMTLRTTVAGTVQEQPSARVEGAFGQLLSDLPSAPEEVIDKLNDCVVELSSDAWLCGADDEALTAGANLAFIGDEVVQFGEAAPIGPRTFRLSKFIRNRFAGSIDLDHPIGSRFVLLERGRLSEVTIPRGALGCSIDVEAISADGTVCEATSIYRGLAMRPWSPVGAQWLFDETKLHLAWTRRSRWGSLWLDNVDVALGEALEQYEVQCFADDVSVFVASTFEPMIAIDRAYFAESGARPWMVEVRQVGDFAVSPPLRFQVSEG